MDGPCLGHGWPCLGHGLACKKVTSFFLNSLSFSNISLKNVFLLKINKLFEIHNKTNENLKKKLKKSKLFGFGGRG